MLGIPRSEGRVGLLGRSAMTAPVGGDGVNRRRQIQMSDDEVRQLLEGSRTVIVCTFNHDGTIHAVPMWHGLVDGDLVFHTKAKSQKALNLRRDDRVTCLVEAGEAYGELRGAELVGRAVVVEDPEELWEIGVSVFDRHIAPYEEAAHREEVRAMLHNRLGFRVLPSRVVSWDHRKLSAPPG